MYTHTLYYQTIPVISFNDVVGSPITMSYCNDLVGDHKIIFQSRSILSYNTMQCIHYLWLALFETGASSDFILELRRERNSKPQFFIISYSFNWGLRGIAHSEDNPYPLKSTSIWSSIIPSLWPLWALEKFPFRDVDSLSDRYVLRNPKGPIFVDISTLLLLGCMSSKPICTA